MLSALLHIDPVIVGRSTAIAAGIGSIWALDYIGRKIDSPQWPFLAPLLLATNPFFIYWSFGGLETSLAALGWMLFVFSQTIFILKNKHIWLAVTFSFFVLLIRPENPIIITLFSISIVVLAIVRHLSWQAKSAQAKEQIYRAVTLLITNSVGIAVLFGLRWVLFGDIFPQPVRAKTSGLSMTAFMQGVHYLSKTLVSLPMVGLTIACIAGCTLLLFLYFFKKTHLPYIMHSLVLVGIYILFVAFSGGDWMEGGRFIVHILPVISIVAIFALSKIKVQPVFLAVVSAIFILQFFGLVQFAKSQSTAIPAWQNKHIAGINSQKYSWFEKHSAVSIRDMPVIAALDHIIENKLKNDPTPIVIMSGQMGMVPYYTAQKYGSKIIWLDRNSLAERSFTLCPISNRWERDETGRLRFSYNTFLKHSAELTSQCNIPTPDIIFDLGAYQGHVEGRGFEVAYSQTGVINAGLFSKNAVDAGEFIAINQKHVELIKNIGHIELKISTP